MFRLKNHDKVPPGNYVYKLTIQDSRESAWFGPCNNTGGCRRFGPSPLINEVAQSVSRFRIANNLSRSSYAEALEDVDTYTCQRIGGLSEWCFNTEQSFGDVNPTAVRPAAGCATCGNKLG
jgi:hypothetical protein